MEKEIKTTVVNLTDDYSSCFGDSCSNKKDKERRPKGYVKLYDIDNTVELTKDNIKDKLHLGKHLGTYEAEQPVVDKNNLIVFDGREWMASLIFGVDNNNITPKADDKIYWIGLGKGGAPEGDPFNPTNPEQDDTDLQSSIMINETDVEYGDYRDSPEQGYYKKLLSSVTYEQDDLNDDRYLIAEVNIIITSADANDIINEAGLFIASEDTPGYNGDFTLFSRVTFPSISKTETRQLVFVWYIYS